MTEAIWTSRPQPALEPDAATIGAWAPATLADLTTHRRQLATTLHQSPGPPGDDESAERLLLAFEELVGNGLRHGRPPVRAAVAAFDGCWLLEVSDAATERPPTPAQGRDAAQGGLGLHLVARICTAHGWQVDGNRKNVWARIDRSTGDLPREDTGDRDRSAPPDPGVAERLVGTVAGFTGALGFAPTTRLSGPVAHLTRDLVTDLCAVVGEALTNVARHAQANSAAVVVAVTAHALTAQVTDDGIGPAAAPRDYGLADLRRRAAWHGGTLTIRPGPAGGTRLIWTVPHRLTSVSSG